ncbi:MAG: zinc-ribbon domain-containing protein [Lachnospiraceae bacterium]
MFCSQCGKEIADGAKFCGYCGSPQNIIPDSVVEKKKTTVKWQIVFLIVLLVVEVCAVTILGIIYSTNKKGNTDREVGKQIENEESEEAPWKEAYCDFLIAVHSEDMEVIREQYPSMADMLNWFFNSNYNSFGLDISERRPVTEEIKFSIIYLNEDEIPELFLSGDYCGLLFSFSDGTVRPVTYQDSPSDIQFFYFDFSNFYYEKESCLVLEDEYSTGEYMGIKVYQYDEDVQYVNVQDEIMYVLDDTTDSPYGEYIGMYNGERISHEEADAYIEEYKEQIPIELKGNYAITRDNLAEVLAYDRVWDMEMELSREPSDEEVVDIGKIFMEGMGREQVREKLNERFDIQYQLFNEEAATRGYYNGVEVYMEEYDNCMYYKNMELDSVRLLGVCPGMEVWKAGLALEDNGFSYNGNFTAQWGGMSFSTGEERGDWVVRLIFEEETVDEIEFFQIE